MILWIIYFGLGTLFGIIVSGFLTSLGCGSCQNRKFRYMADWDEAMDKPSSPDADGNFADRDTNCEWVNYWLTDKEQK